jgi:hypothetical protein
MGETAKLYGFAAPGSRLRKAFNTFGVVTRTRMTAGKLASTLAIEMQLTSPFSADQ